MILACNVGEVYLIVFVHNLFKKDDTIIYPMYSPHVKQCRPAREISPVCKGQSLASGLRHVYRPFVEAAGVEPALSMMYFYVETYTKVFVPQALATELHPQKNSLLRYHSGLAKKY